MTNATSEFGVYMEALSGDDLRAARLAAGWSISEAVREMRRHAAQPLPKVDALVRSWKRWEKGTIPGRIYRPLLTRLFAGVGATAEHETVDAFPERASIPRATWLQLVDAATERVEIFAFAATFFHQLTPGIGARVATAADRGAQVRLCFAHPDSQALAVREVEERLLAPGLLATKARTTLGYFTGLVGHPRCEIRLHRATVYASLFRFDDLLFVNPHVYKAPANGNPLLRLGVDSALFKPYTVSFDEAWEEAAPWNGEPV